MNVLQSLKSYLFVCLLGGDEARHRTSQRTTCRSGSFFQPCGLQRLDWGHQAHSKLLYLLSSLSDPSPTRECGAGNNGGLHPFQASILRLHSIYNFCRLDLLFPEGWCCWTRSHSRGPLDSFWVVLCPLLGSWMRVLHSFDINRLSNPRFTNVFFKVVWCFFFTPLLVSSELCSLIGPGLILPLAVLLLKRCLKALSTVSINRLSLSSRLLGLQICLDLYHFEWI